LEAHRSALNIFTAASSRLLHAQAR
jgi:hypothetical protein